MSSLEKHQPRAPRADCDQLVPEAHLAAMVDDIDAAHAEWLIVIHPLHAYEKPGEGQTSLHIRQIR